MIRHTSGVICVPIAGPDLDRLQLPLMTAHNDEQHAHGASRSAWTRGTADQHRHLGRRPRRGRSARWSTRPPSAYELVRPGHIFPLRYAEGGVLRRPGHTEAAVDLARLAGLSPAGRAVRGASTTTAPWPGCPSCGRSPTSTTWR
mgnify:CR=1 FL=1